MKAAFHTLGCKVNQYETEAMKEQFKAFGAEIADENDFADVYIINTCTVTNIADRKSRQYIRRMKKKNPDAVIAVTGCYAQVKPEEIMALPEVDIVAGTGEKNNIIDYVRRFMEEKKPQTHIKRYEELCEYQDRGIITSMESRTRAYIKVQEGCNRFCAYCLIPFARGMVRSRDPREIVKEAKALIDKGFKELILTGINTALYGTEDGFKDKFPMWVSDEKNGMESLISAIDGLPGEFRIRLSSLEPAVVNADYVKRLLKYERLCHHLHLSAQSGSDNVLSMMNRPYNRKDYLDIVEVLRQSDELYGISTDIIVGFPGETEQDFSDSKKLIEEAGFCKVHPFKYSKRDRTAAALMENQIPPEIKNRRMDEISSVSEKAVSNFLTKCIGDRRIVLFEEQEGPYVTGYTDNYIKVYVKGNELNCFKEVKLLEIYKDGMKGEI
ncbi:MAG: tRNA (N(6)-L-threonylcarbamoyladenosine(37)-C(2))-methylthiotransferase MtaB [Anaerovoracaceae bacterium]|nr:tRNA (N(6)-L-threonylcarbamoyladenosine(37)-C(2))-methylthiotransferase MtaB [Anaerovoracaceae bacterium]